MRLIYEKLYPDAFAPTKAYPEDAGWDLRARQSYALTPGMVQVIQTGLAIRLEPSPEQSLLGVSWYWRAADKSGLASRGIHILGGVVDRNYRGGLGVIVANLGFYQDGKALFTHWEVKPGDKICQLVPEMIWDVRDAVEGVVGSSDRGSNGFGSTG